MASWAWHQAGLAGSAVGSGQRAQTAEARGRGSRGRKEGKKAAESGALTDPSICVRTQMGRPLCTRSGCARYLHDRLGEVPGTPVTEAGLHRGRDEASVSCSVIRVVGGLRGHCGGEGGRENRRVIIYSTHLFVGSRGLERRQKSVVWLLRTFFCGPHFCVLVAGDPDCVARAPGNLC